MMSDGIALQRAMNAHPRDRTPQLVYADWCDENEQYRKAAHWRGQSIVGLVGLVGLGGLGGLGGQLLNLEAPIVLIPGENVLAFMPHGYGFAVFVGTVEAEYPYGWVLNPARTVERAGSDEYSADGWVPLAGGDKKVRRESTFGAPITGGVRLPIGVMSMPWMGELPK